MRYSWNIPGFVTHNPLIAESEHGILCESDSRRSKDQGAHQNKMVMRKHSQAGKSKRLEKAERSDSILENKVHELLEYIESQFKTEDRIKRTFAAAALTGALKILDEISRKEGVAREIKIDLLSQIARAATDRADKLSRTAAGRPTAFWSERGTDKRYVSPCDWVKEHWPTYGHLILSDIRETDRPLYRALIYYKREYGWPNDFKIQTKEQHNSQLLKEAGGRVDLRNIEELPSEVRRQRRRLLAAQRYRAGKASPAR